MTSKIGTLKTVVLDAPDHRALARFYVALTGGEERYADLCRPRHKSAYAEHRIMPSLSMSCLVRGISEAAGSA
jgi:hypothetical protein